MPETTIVISFPNWFYGILTIGFLAFVFYLGFRYFQIREICKNYSKDIPKIQRSLTRISEILLQKNMTTHDVYTISNSPIQLTNDGKKAIEESKFNLFYEKNKYELIERVKKKNPKNLADLEEACKSVMLSIKRTYFKLVLAHYF